jgi:DNA-binding protein YbaB
VRTAHSRPSGPVLGAEEAHAGVQQRRAELGGRVEAAERVREQLAQLRVSERSERVAIEVVVSGRGTLLGLTLGESTSRVAPQDMAAEILATVHRASDRASEQVAQLLESALPAGTDITELAADPALAEDRRARAVGHHRSTEPDDDLSEPESWLRPVQVRGGR